MAAWSVGAILFGAPGHRLTLERTCKNRQQVIRTPRLTYLAQPTRIAGDLHGERTLKKLAGDRSPPGTFRAGNPGPATQGRPPRAGNPEPATQSLQQRAFALQGRSPAGAVDSRVMRIGGGRLGY